MRISYSPEAVDDLVRLREFIEVHNPTAARRIAKAIREGIKQLKSFPYLGVAVARAPNPEIIRDLVVGKYIVRYLIRSDDLYILRVWHQKENRID